MAHDPTPVIRGVLCRHPLHGQLIHCCTFFRNNTCAPNSSHILHCGFYSQSHLQSLLKWQIPLCQQPLLNVIIINPDDQTIPEHIVEAGPVIAGVRQSPQFCDVNCDVPSCLTYATVELEPLDHNSCLRTVVLLHDSDQIVVCLVSWFVRGDQTSQQLPSNFYAGAPIKVRKQASVCGLDGVRLKKVFHALCVLIPFLITGVKLPHVSEPSVHLGVSQSGPPSSPPVTFWSRTHEPQFKMNRNGTTTAKSYSL